MGTKPRTLHHRSPGVREAGTKSGTSHHQSPGGEMAGTKSGTSQHQSPGEERRGRKRRLTIFLERTRKYHRQLNQLRNRFGAITGETT